VSFKEGEIQPILTSRGLGGWLALGLHCAKNHSNVPGSIIATSGRLGGNFNPVLPYKDAWNDK